MVFACVVSVCVTCVGICLKGMNDCSELCNVVQSDVEKEESVFSRDPDDMFKVAISRQVYIWKTTPESRMF